MPKKLQPTGLQIQPHTFGTSWPSEISASPPLLTSKLPQSSSSHRSAKLSSSVTSSSRSQWLDEGGAPTSGAGGCPVPSKGRKLCLAAETTWPLQGGEGAAVPGMQKRPTGASTLCALRSPPPFHCLPQFTSPLHRSLYPTGGGGGFSVPTDLLWGPLRWHWLASPQACSPPLVQPPHWSGSASMSGRRPPSRPTLPSWRLPLPRDWRRLHGRPSLERWWKVQLNPVSLDSQPQIHP